MLEQSAQSTTEATPSTPIDAHSSQINAKITRIRVYLLLLAIIALAAVLTLTIWVRGLGSSVHSFAYRLPVNGKMEDQDLLALSLRQAAIEGKLDALTTLLTIGFGFTVLLVIYSEYRSYNADQRAEATSKQSEDRATEAFRLTITGEKASQQRAEETHQKFLEGSVKTLNLVNETLGLAVQASQRAADTMVAKAKKELQELDEHCNSLISAEPNEERALINSSQKVEVLTNLAQRINAFAINSFLLPAEMTLPPSCDFIWGMYLHLEQRQDSAIKHWRIVTSRAEAPDYLRSQAWYWIGYEQNNLGQFDAADASFGYALEPLERDKDKGSKHTADLRYYELKRIQLETRFFSTRLDDHGLTLQLYQEMDALHSDLMNNEGISPTREKRREKICTTLANVASQIGDGILLDEEKKDWFRKAYNLYNQFSASSKWALFGEAEMLSRLGQDAEAVESYRRAREAASDEFQNRMELRTKILAKTSELICCCHIPRGAEDLLGIWRDLDTLIGALPKHLTVYSQFSKRNVWKADLRADLLKLYNEESVKAEA